MTTGLRVAATESQFFDCVPESDHSTAWVLSVRNTRVIPTTRPSKAPKRTSCACSTASRP